jgi:hypothetical protein
MEKMTIENGNYELWFESKLETNEIVVYLYDVYHQSRTKLVSWFGTGGKIPGGEWANDHMNNKNLFFELAKQYRSGVVRRMNKCKAYLATNGEGDQSFATTWNCFKRRVNIKIHKILK